MHTHYRFLVTGVVAALALVAANQGAQAQMDGPFPNYAADNTYSIMSTHIANLSLQNVVDRQYGHQKNAKSTVRSTRRGDSQTKSTLRGSSASASTGYASTPAVTQKVIKQYLAWSKTQSTKDAAYLKTAFSQHNPIQIWRDGVREDGLKTGDVSDALAAYWVLNYLIANQKTTSTRAQALAVRAQVQPLLASNPGFKQLSNAQRQEMAEVWMVNFVVQQGAYGNALKNKNSDMMQKLATAATIRFKNEMGLDLRRLTLTNQGFKSRA